jgi:hypothetical protein
MTSVSAVAHLADTASGPSRCPRNRKINDSKVLQTRSILPVTEEQSRTRGGQRGRVTDQPQHRGLLHSSSPSALSLSLSPSPPPPSFTQSPSLPCSLVCDGQTGPHRPRLVFSHRTCPLLSPSPPHANRLMMMPVIGTAVINTHTQPDTTKPWLLGPTRNHVNPLIDGHGSRRSMRGLLDMVELSVTPWYSFNGP